MVNNLSFSEPSENMTSYAGMTERAVLASLFLAISLTGSVGNLMVIIAVALSKTLRTKTNVFVVSLRLADFLACLAMPWWSVALLSGDDWLIPGTEWICTVSGMVIFMSIGVSMWSITFIAVNRLILITRPLATYQKVYTSRNIRVMTFFSYTIAVIIVGLPTFVGFGKIGFVPESHTCSDMIITPTAEIYDLNQGIVTSLLLTTVFACYIKMYLHIKSHFKERKRLSVSLKRAGETSTTDVEASAADQNVQTTSKNIKKIDRDMIEVTKNLFVCVCILMFCLIPISVVNIVSVPPKFHVYAWVVAFANSAVNPLIYASRYPHFKVVLRLMLRCRYADIPQPSNILQKYCSKTDFKMDCIAGLEALGHTKN